MDGSPNVLSGDFSQRYSIEHEIGRGATAVVYHARDLAHDRPVAIKILKPELAQSSGAERFLREIKLTARLKGPHILPVLDSGDNNGQLFFVLPLMKDGTLRQRLMREKQLAINEAVSIATTVAEALTYAHKQNLVHRDVKPENILFSEKEICLADFGIARAIERSIEDSTTSTGIVRGTPAYMSPEQASGEHHYDGRSDIYSLACVLYEMLAGIPAFVGPTAKSVMAQRLHHPPRSVRVYRENVPVALDAAILRALEITPSDRFATASAFSDALSEALARPDASAQPSARRSFFRRFPVSTTIIGASIGLGLVGWAAVESYPRLRSMFVSSPPAADTTRLVILPLEGASGTGPFKHDDLLHQAVSRWRGIDVVDRFQVSDAMRQSGGAHSLNETSTLVRSLGAGRYIRGQTTPSGNFMRAYVALYDVRWSRPLFSVSEAIPSDANAAASTYIKLVESLLLRGEPMDSETVSRIPRPSLPAIQAFGQAERALDDWDLSAADSSFQTAVSFDSDYAKASLWLAQVRAWREPNRRTSRALAERAISLGNQLSEREMMLARALLFLAQAKNSLACREYDQLLKRNKRDFAAWFGLGQCRSSDRIVVPDSTSPSGWRFRSSARAAMRAYRTAFEILPSVHRGYERGAFERLRELLLVSSDLRAGYAIGDSSLFYGRPGWIADTLALIPYPWKIIFAGDSSSIPPGFNKALEQRRNEFKRIASGWSEAFPASPGAKYAVAISLELLGNRSAIDTIRLARILEKNPSRKTHLAAAEALMRFKFGIPDNPELIEGARSLTDSLFADSTRFAFASGNDLAPLAALTGRCSKLDTSVRASTQAGGYQRIPDELIADVNVLLARIAAGCEAEPKGLRQILSSLREKFPPDKKDDLRRAEQTLFYRLITLEPSLDPFVTERVAAGGGTDLLIAASAAAKRNKSKVKAALVEMDRKIDPGVPTPDIVLAKAKLWIQAGSKDDAIRTLDSTLEFIQAYDTKVLDDPVNAGALIRSMLLRADLAAARADTIKSKRWSGAAAKMLASADKEARSLAREF